MVSNQGNILVVDDEEGIRSMISKAVSPHGYRVLSAENVREAFETITKEHIDLILLDLHMPGLYGHELLRFLRECGSDLPVIILSAYVEEMLADDLRKSVSAILKKPFSIHKLVDEIDKALWDRGGKR